MKIVFHDNGLHLRFAPFTLTRPVAELRCGMYKNSERWNKMLGTSFSDVAYVTEVYLDAVFPTHPIEEEALYVNSAVIPNEKLALEVENLKNGETLVNATTWIAKKGNWNGTYTTKTTSLHIVELKNTWDLFLLNAQILENDFQFATKNKKSQAISTSNTIIGDVSRVFLEEGARLEASILNTQNGPIYLGKNAEIMEGAMVRGGLALMDESCLKMGTKLYGATSIGVHCKIGGEVSNSIFFSYSNKGHDGFLGNSIIGEWCNLGADTNSSNLKNNYSKVKAYSYESKQLEQTDLQFLGLMMGDHSKSGINTMFNTATTTGVCANVFGEGFPPKYIPSFSWGGQTTEVFNFEKACEAIQNMMQRREKKLSEAEVSILHYLSNPK